MTITKDSSIAYPTRTTGGNWYSGGAQGADTVTSRTVTVARRRTGTRLPNHRKVISDGENATTPLTARWETVEYSGTPHGFSTQIYTNPSFPGKIWTRRNLGNILETNDTANFLGLDPTLDISFVDNLARAAFFKKLHTVERQFQGYVFLGELQETLRMLRHPTQTLHNLAKDFLGTLGKRKRANPKSWMNGLGQAWLEQSFGWKPLMNDISDAVKAYNRFTKPTQQVQISASSKKIYDLSNTLSGFGKVGSSAILNQGCVWRCVYSTLFETHTVRYKGALRSRVECPRWGDYSLFGFEPKEFIPAAWELLPWSFLVDYFTNIGDILDASVTSVRDVVYINKSTIKETLRRRDILNDVSAANKIPPGSGWSSLEASSNRISGIYKRKIVERIANSGLDLPNLQFNFSLSDGQLGNVAALLTQANALHPQNSPRRWHR